MRFQAFYPSKIEAKRCNTVKFIRQLRPFSYLGKNVGYFLYHYPKIILRSIGHQKCDVRQKNYCFFEKITTFVASF
jgi:hypothetical protein